MHSGHSNLIVDEFKQLRMGPSPVPVTYMNRQVGHGPISHATHGNSVRLAEMREGHATRFSLLILQAGMG